MTKKAHPARLFTVEEANATLPLVQRITHDLQELASEIIDRRQRLALLTDGREARQGDPYAEELEAIRKQLEQDEERAHEYFDELRQIGVEPKGAAEGLVDFPTMIDGELAYLCWQLGEPELLHWHPLDGGFAGRQPLTVESAASGGAETGGLEG